MIFAIYATYRGRSRRRAEYVSNVVSALQTSDVVSDCRHAADSVDALVCLANTPENAGGLVLTLLQAGDFAIGIGCHTPTGQPFDDAYPGATNPDGTDDAEDADASAEHDELRAAAARAVPSTAKAGSVSVRIEYPGPGGALASGRAVSVSEDIAHAFTLLAFILSRRTKEGREATALLRAGHLQSEAAEIVGITKQAMSQRLAAAGWQAEQAGWSLAVHMLSRVAELP